MGVGAGESKRGGTRDTCRAPPPPRPPSRFLSGTNYPEPGPTGHGTHRAARAHSLVSQSSPSQPLGQKQRKASTSSMHVPPLRHGCPRQSSMSAGRGGAG